MRLLFIGDSLIEFFDWETRFAGHEVYNFGVAGETVEGLYRRLPAIVAKVPFPDFVFVMSGINNLAMEDSGFITTYGAVIERLRHAWPSVRIFVHSLLPVGTPFLSNDEIRAMNSRLRALAEQERAGYADIHPLFLDESGVPNASCLLEDGVHLSDTGYRLWSARIEEIITRTIEG
ncbi:MAG: GDSL-type esterase/lipase family protein [Nitrospiraceae bacterium]|nr:GDSL-type esterase/lipase family protein [Nitrospiraceae bacterium]